jgi:arabinose-5-phosphate isomerase
MKLNQEQVLTIANEALSLEITGLLDLQKQTLNETFYKTCELINQNKGRLICTGIGKSGHIANKIAATLSSTGTLSFYIHPTEALHGDLGMIAQEDIILMISNSGNTAELNGIINYALRFNIPIIAITKNTDSILGKASTYCLTLPNSKEACPLGLAPTTSTTNTLALGDALAVSLLKMKGFKEEDFKIFHPGGSLGKQLITLNEIMHKDVPSIGKEASMQEAIITITSHKFGCVAIVENDQIIGIITDGDIRRHMDNNFLNKKVIEVMNPNFITIDKDETTSKALNIMQSKKITNLIVQENKKPIGIVHIQDLLAIKLI